MQFQLVDSNKGIFCQQPPSTPFFSRLAWFTHFEKVICNNEFKAKTFQFTTQEKQLYLPMASIGKQLKSLTNYYSPFYQMLGNVEVTTQDQQAAINVSKDEFKQYDIIDLLPLYQTDAINWHKAFENIGFKGYLYQHSINWFHENITDLDQYWSLRPSKLRNTLKRKKNKIEKSGEYIIEITSPDNIFMLNKYLADYHHVYYDSWKQEEPYPAFIDAIAEYAWQQGELRLGMVYHKETPVAAQIWFVNGETAYIFKLAYRRDYTKTSVGTVLTAAMMEHVIDKDKVTCVDFLTGDDSYKKDWMQSQRPLIGLQLCNPRTWQGKKTILRNTLSSIRKQVAFRS